MGFNSVHLNAPAPQARNAASAAGGREKTAGGREKTGRIRARLRVTPHRRRGLVKVRGKFMRPRGNATRAPIPRTAAAVNCAFHVPRDALSMGRRVWSMDWVTDEWEGGVECGGGGNGFGGGGVAEV